MKLFIASLFCITFFNGCNKIKPDPVKDADGFEIYTIAAGAHYCDQSVLKYISLNEQVFDVKFDSSAIYTTVNPQSQYDINKLYGFSEGIDPHVNSARIGWSYNNNKLRLYAYIYNNGERRSQELSVVNIGSIISCSIKADTNYIFKVNNITKTLPRFLQTTVVAGYQLFPYFGGGETAPHPVKIYIRPK